MTLRGKSILITAGPTWVAIDSVRVISNIATGETGILLAQRLQRRGAKITLLLGATGHCTLSKKIHLIRFRYFGDLKNKIADELERKKYDILIHSAAVSDYRPKRACKDKIKSGIKSLKINLVPTPKIINLIKKINRSLVVVGFKFEPSAAQNMLLGEAKKLIEQAQLDLAVANTVDKQRYKAYIISRNKIYGVFRNKSALTNKLINLLSQDRRI